MAYDSKEKKDAYSKIFKIKNPNYARDYYLKNKEKLDKHRLEWRLKNPDKMRNLYEKHREKNLQHHKEYYQRTKAQRVAHQLNKRKQCPEVKIRHNLQSRMLTAIKLNGSRKNTGTTTLLGCSIQELKLHIESKFQHGMSWLNYGVYRLGEDMTWHIDHIIPCAAFDLTDPEQQKKCFHYTNLQPLWAVDNIVKGDKV